MDNMWNLPTEQTSLPGENLCFKMCGPELHVAVTAAGRSMATNLIYLLAKGDVFGEDQPVVLHLVDTPPQIRYIRGFSMELINAGFPLLKDCIATNQLETAFKDIDVAILLPYPKLTTQKSRRDRLEETFALAKLHGEVLNLYAKRTVKVMLVGHRANTKAFICSRFAPHIPTTNFTAVSRHIQNFAQSLLALKLRVNVQNIKDVLVWGNISELTHADLHHSTVKMPHSNKEMCAHAAAKNDHWIKGEFNDTVRKTTYDTTDNARTISMAVAAAEHLHDWWQGTQPDRLTSMVVVSDGSYDIPKGFFFSFPVVVKDGEWKIVKGLNVDLFDYVKIQENVEELKREHEEAIKLCKQFWDIPGM